MPSTSATEGELRLSDGGDGLWAHRGAEFGPRSHFQAHPLVLSTMLNTDALGFLQLQLETLVLSYRPVTPRGHFQHRLFFECHLALREQRQVFVEVGKATLMIAHQ